MGFFSALSQQPSDPLAVKKPGVLTYLTRGPVGYDQQQSAYIDYQKEQRDQQDYSGLFSAARGAGDDPMAQRKAELDYISQHPRLAPMGMKLLEPQTPIKLGADESIYSPNDFTKPLATGPAKDRSPSGYRQNDDGTLSYIPGGPGDPKVIKQGAESRHITINTGPSGPGLTDSGLDLAAQQYRLTRTLPPLGMGASAAGLRQKIINRAAELSAIDGQGAEDTVIAQSGFRAQEGALRDIRTRRARLEQNEKFANRNLDLVEQASIGVSRTGGTLLNELSQKGVNALIGDPALTRFQNAIETFIPEYAKVMSGGNPVLSDQATHRAEGLLKSSMNPKVFKAAVAQLRAEMANQGPSYDEQEKGIMDSMHPQKSGAAKPDPLGIRK